jgi:predicted DNA binding CopG/RHH family protein
MSATMKQLNIRLPEQTHRELKAKCALEGLTLAVAIEELVRAYVAGKVKITLRADKLE